MAPADSEPAMTAQVIPIRKPVAVSPRHPSMHGRHTHPPATVTLDRVQAELIASLLRSTRHLAPQPQAIDAAIELLTGVK
jgi:hypothetical protein